jgi:hypothetical protein
MPILTIFYINFIVQIFKNFIWSNGLVVWARSAVFPVCEIFVICGGIRIYAIVAHQTERKTNLTKLALNYTERNDH